MKKTLLILAGLSLMAFGCKKKDKEENKEEVKPNKAASMKVVKKKVVEKKVEKKKVVKKKVIAKIAAPAIAITQKTAKKVIGIRFKAEMKDLKVAFTKNYGLLGKFLAKNKLKMVGPPMACYYNWDPKKPLDVEAIFMVDKKIKGDKVIKFHELPAVKGVTAMHIGPYQKLRVTWNLVMDYIKAKKLKTMDMACEIYLNNPTKTKPELLKTQIFFPLKK
jgi:effector-binding domain-containing protein